MEETLHQLGETRDRIIRQLHGELADPQIDLKRRDKLVADFLKIAADLRAERKLELDRRKLDLLEKKIDAGLAAARQRVRAAQRVSSEVNPADLEDPAAPYGRRPDGDPYSHAEFCELLDQAVADIYGFDIRTGNLVPRETKAPGVHPEASSPDFDDRKCVPGTHIETAPADPRYRAESAQARSDSTEEMKHRVDKVVDMSPDHPHRKDHQRDPRHHQPDPHVRRKAADRVQPAIQLRTDRVDP